MSTPHLRNPSDTYLPVLPMAKFRQAGEVYFLAVICSWEANINQKGHLRGVL